MATKKLLLLDGVGALLSAISLGIVLPTLNSWFLLPVNLLQILGGIAAVFSIYSLSSFFLSGKKWRKCLRIIAIANFAYCVLTAWFVFSYLADLTVLAITYFIGEIILVVFLAIWELKVAYQK